MPSNHCQEKSLTCFDKTPLRTPPRRRVLKAVLTTSCLAALLAISGRDLKAETITAPTQHFTASPSQSVFPTDNLNLFKQFLFDWNPDPIGIGSIADPTWFPGKYGARVTFGTQGSFGFEFGLCLGGNVDFDLGFQPQLTVPDRQVIGVGLPIIITAPQISGSHFNTTFDGIGQAYADLIMDARANVDSTICLIGCTGALRGGFDTRSLLDYSIRCDTNINAINPPKVGIELASMNRGDNGILRVLNVSTPPFGGPLSFSYSTNTPGTTNDSEISLAGEISISNPRIETDSINSIFCQSGIVCSSGSADVFELSLDVGEFINALIPKPKLPPPFEEFEFNLKNNFSYKGLSASYVLADLNVGPVIKLKMDHEMDWALWVTEMYFTVPNSTTPRQIKIGGQTVTNLADLFPDKKIPAGRYHLSNVGPNALPLIELINKDEEVEVHLSYQVAPKFKTKVSTPVIGRIQYELLSASAGFSSGPFDFGPYGVGPGLKGTKEFDVANFNAYTGQKTLKTPDVGHIAFTMKAVGSASYEWLGGLDWSDGTKWRETNTMTTGQAPTTVSDAVIPAVTGIPRAATANTEIAALMVRPGGGMHVLHGAGVQPNFAVNRGFVDNQGLITLSDDSVFYLDSTNAMLCGLGSLRLNPSAQFGAPSLQGYTGLGDFSFINYNTISGAGNAMAQYGDNSGLSTIHNLGTYSADILDATLRMSANRILNETTLGSSAGARLAAFADRLETSAGSWITADGAGSRTHLEADTGEHAGTIRASNGGRIEIAQWSYPQRSAWNGGLAINEDKGIFNAIGAGSQIYLEGADMTGGCFLLNDGGSLEAMDASFMGSVINIGTSDAGGFGGTGFLSLTGAGGNLFGVVLNNFGTLTIPTQVKVIGSKIFANHGTIEIPVGGRLEISSNAPIQVVSVDPDTQEVTSELLSQPGTINASADKLLGGTWRVAGSLLIAGASFTSTGADPGSGSASSGYVDTNGVAQSGNPTDDTARALAYGRPANVILDGPTWNFPALNPLQENGGQLSLVNGAGFTAQQSFTNRGSLLLGGSPASRFDASGSYVQMGANANTTVQAGGSLAAATGEYQFIGGTLNGEAGSTVFGYTSSAAEINNGVSLTFASTLNPVFTGIGPDDGFDYEVEPCWVNLTGGILALRGNSSVHVHGDVRFPGLSQYLAQIDAGSSLTVSGDNLNPGRLELSQSPTFTPVFNSGDVAVTGYASELKFGGNYTQNLGTTTVGRNARMRFLGDLAINGGDFIVELGPREEDINDLSYLSAPVIVNGDGDLGDNLIVRFVEVGYADLGDVWVLVSGGNTLLPTSVTFEGISLAPFTRLEVVEDDPLLNGSGLIVKVVSDVPTLAYTNWLNAYAIAPETWVPELDSDNDGITDGNEFIFGSNPKVADTQDFTLMIPGLYEAPNGDLFLEISYDRPAGAQRREAFYNAYLTDHLPASDGEWRPGIFTVANIANITPDLERVTMRSTIKVADADNLFARIGGGIPGFLPPPGLTPDNPLPDPGDLTLERGNVGKVIYYRIQGDETSNGGSVIGGPQYYDRSSLKRTVVHAGAVPHGEYGVVKLTILEGLTDYVGSTSNGVTSESLPNGPDTPGPDAGSVSYTVEPVTSNLLVQLSR